jgi:hypothetical protein
MVLNVNGGVHLPQLLHILFGMLWQGLILLRKNLRAVIKLQAFCDNRNTDSFETTDN